MFRTPPCSNCGSKLFVVRIRTSGALFPPSERYYRCFRCFSKFSPPGEQTGDPVERSVPDSVTLPGEDGPRVEIVDTILDIEERGTKLAVETFDVTVENRTDEEVLVTNVRLTFDGEEEQTPPKDPVSVPPNETRVVDIHLDWIHPEHETVTIEARADGESVAATTVAIETVLNA